MDRTCPQRYFCRCRRSTGVVIAIFYTADVPEGYTSLDLNYIDANNIILALKLNDITLPPDRGFPFQVVAKSKFGYKWAKWVTHIELSSNTNFRGYWESNGYNNNADINGPPGNRLNIFLDILTHLHVT